MCIYSLIYTYIYIYICLHIERVREPAAYTVVGSSARSCIALGTPHLATCLLIHSIDIY